MNDLDRRSMPLFSIGIVMKLTELTARQIRYYEANDLIAPERTKGNQRLFSFNDVDRLLQIKDLLDKGLNMAGIKLLLDEEDGKGTPQNETPKQEEKKDTANLTDRELRDILRNELNEVGRYGKASMRQGELARFFIKH